MYIDWNDVHNKSTPSASIISSSFWFLSLLDGARNLWKSPTYTLREFENLFVHICRITEIISYYFTRIFIHILVSLLSHCAVEWPDGYPWLEEFPENKEIVVKHQVLNRFWYNQSRKFFFSMKFLKRTDWWPTLKQWWKKITEKKNEPCYALCKGTILVRCWTFAPKWLLQNSHLSVGVCRHLSSWLHTT